MALDTSAHPNKDTAFDSQKYSFESQEAAMGKGSPAQIVVVEGQPLIVKAEGHVKVVAIKTAQEAYDFMGEAGEKKQHQPIWKLVILGMKAGALLAFGAALAAAVGGEYTGDTASGTLRVDNPGLFNIVYGAFGLPFGLLMIILTGAELFTSNNAIMTIGMFEGKVGLYGLVKSWVFSWLANLLGSLIIVWLCSAGKVFSGHEAFPILLATKKTGYPFHVALTKGILCNWLVCMAVFQALMAEDLTGKFVGVFLPISAFVALGAEHCIANMFFVPMGMKLGAHVSVSAYITKNAIPVTIGNVIGGAFFMATGFAFTYGTPAKMVQKYYDMGLRAAFGKLYTDFQGWALWPMKTAEKHLEEPNKV